MYTDHKPLILLMKRPIHEAPVRIQRLLLCLQRYNIELIFKLGKNHFIPDALSRAYVVGKKSEAEKCLEHECEQVVHAVIDSVNCTSSTMQK